MSAGAGGEPEKDLFPRRFAVLFSILFLIAYWPGFLLIPGRGLFAHIEDVWHDKLFYFNSSRLPSGDPRIVILAIDEETGKRHGFPLPRRLHAQLLDRARDYGVKSVVFDVLFLDPSPQDAALIEATRRFKKTVHLFQTETKATAVGEVVSLRPPIPGLGEASEFLGYPNIDPVLDNDGRVRRAVLFDPRTHDPLDPERMAASLVAAALASYTGASIDELRERWGTRPLLVNFRVPRVWLKHEKRDAPLRGKVANLQEVEAPYRHISMMDFLAGELSDEQKRALRGALMIVGSTTIGYFDHYPTPFIPQAPGAEYHANVIDNILRGDYLRPVARSWVMLAILGMIWAPLALTRLPPLGAAAAAFGLLGFWVGLSWWQFLRGVRLEAVAPSAALLSSFLVQMVHRVRAEGQEKKFIKGLFAQFVAPEVVDDLAKNPKKVRLGGEKAEMTVFFLDIAHFTNISEKVDPQALIQFLNKYLSALSATVHEHKGVVDKYIGDCIMAFWNPPILPAADHRARAALAAIECQEVVRKLNKDLDGSLPEVPAIRIGLNAGTVTVGLTGSERKLQYTVLGDEVNLASRLEGANKFFGSSIIASESVYQGAKDAVAARELGRVRVVGKEKPIRVYELIAAKGRVPEEWRRALAHWETGYGSFYRGDYEAAIVAFQELLKIFPNDGPATLYLNTSRDYAAIPPDDKDIVFNLTAK